MKIGITLLLSGRFWHLVRSEEEQNVSGLIHMTRNGTVRVDGVMIEIVPIDESQQFALVS